MNYERMTKAQLIKTLEELLAARSAVSDSRATTVEENTDEMQPLVHELRVHQIELEMQNRELREAQQALEESRNRYVDLYDFAPVGYASLNDKGCIEEINLTGAALLGVERSRLAGKPFISFVGKSDREKFLHHLQQCKRAEGKVVTELTLEGKHKGPVEVQLLSVRLQDAERQAILYRTTITDITERKELEDQLRQSHKMEAIGTLAGGVAHDFNNLLTAIIGYTELTLIGLSQVDPLRSRLGEIRKAAERAVALTQQLLAFSRKQMLQPRVLDLNILVADSAEMLRRLIGEDIELVTVLDPALAHVKADPGQIVQVIINLAINARDAMPQGGRLTIETAGVYLDEDYVRRHISVRPGLYMMLAVSDTGSGMGPEAQSHIFEPFFTTKEKGKGTGLGLSTVYGIVKQSGGNIWVYSKPGQGASFKIYLPCTDEAVEIVATQAALAEMPTGSETVLVAEDEEIVRGLVCETLRLNGYCVLEATSGEEALLIGKQHVGPIHLMVTDMVMPQMSGRELASRVTLSRPAMKVLYMSGYTENGVVHHGILVPGMAFIQKPFTPDALARKIREVLGDTAVSLASANS